MDSMKAKTEQMSSTTDEMKETTTVMYQQIRSKEAEDTRNKKFTILKSKDENFGEKIAAAAVYFKSFEFQLWSGQQNVETGHMREQLILDAVNEFTRRIGDIYENINLKKMSPTNSGKKHSAEEAFYALSATMHMNHGFQEELVGEKSEIKKISFYDVVKRALEKDSLGEAMTDYEEILVSGLNKEIMIELIKARVDMLSALALKNLTDKRDMTFGQKLKAALFKISEGRLGSIELPETFEKSNGPTKKQTIKYLEAANKSKNFLFEIGIQKQLEKTLKSAFSKIKLENHDSQSEGLDSSSENNDSDSKRVEIKKLIDELLQ